LIENASITLVRKSDLKSDTAINETKGIYKCSEIKASESYFVKVESPDYVPNEFSIGVNDLKGGKKTWEVLLRKKKTEVRGALISSKTAATIGIQLPVRLQRELNAINNASKGPIYVIDGTIMAQKTDINPADIDNIEVLQGPAAFALFGSEGANGAIVITTRKAKEIKLKEVVVNAEVGLKGRMAGGISYTTTYEESLVVDTIATLKTLLTDSIKVYPNPVQRNTELSVQLKLKQPGNNYRMLVTDATGKILLQRKFNASAKDHTEKITGNSGWAAGTYYIRIFDTQNKLISKTGFIFH
jgi:TonB-dependent SusC/RagA subfamily outer membrane receptor